MSSVLRTAGLGKRYGTRWALRDCSLAIPAGHISALVGANGAGKTTLLRLAVGMAQPSSGEIEVFGWSPRQHQLLIRARIGYVGQDRPLYRQFTVAEMLELGRRLNSRWDAVRAESRLRRLEIPLGARVGHLSGGQQAQVALAIALGKRPDLLLLDEPVANLDPLARRQFLRELTEAVADDGLSVVLSSHLISELERVCDHIVVLSEGGVQLSGGLDDLMMSHKLLVGPRLSDEAVRGGVGIIQATHSGAQTALLVRTEGRRAAPEWEVHDVGLEEIVLAYLGNRGAGRVNGAIQVAS